MARSLNKATLIGNLTRDPELRYTPQGTAVCTFGVATNRQWKTESGDQKDEAEFHKIVAWDKLAEICSKMLKKGNRVFVEGRIQTRNWDDQSGNKRSTTEIVISDMILLESRGGAGAVRATDDINVPEDLGAGAPAADMDVVDEPKATPAKAKKAPKGKKEEVDEDIPF